MSAELYQLAPALVFITLALVFIPILAGLWLRRVTTGVVGIRAVYRSSFRWFLIPKALAVLALILLGLALIASSFYWTKSTVKDTVVTGLELRREYILSEPATGVGPTYRSVKPVVTGVNLIQEVIYDVVWKQGVNEIQFILGMAVLVISMALAAYWMARLNNE